MTIVDVKEELDEVNEGLSFFDFSHLKSIFIAIKISDLFLN